MVNAYAKKVFMMIIKIVFVNNVQAFGNFLIYLIH